MTEYTKYGTGMDADMPESGSSTDAAKQQVSQMAQQAQQQATQVARQAQRQAATQFSTQKDRAADQLGTLSDALRQTGQQLRTQDQATFAQYADKLADRVDSFSQDLQHKDLNQIVSDVEHFARRQPAVFLGGAFVLGLLGARFLKSASPSSTSYSSYSSPSYSSYRGATGQDYTSYRGDMGQTEFGKSESQDYGTGTYQRGHDLYGTPSRRESTGTTGSMDKPDFSSSEDKGEQGLPPEWRGSNH